MASDLGCHLLAATANDWWTEEFFGLEANERFVVILTFLGCVTGVIITLGGILYSAINAAHRRRIEADLKKDMLDLGMSADDVVKVIEAASPPEDATDRWIASWCRKK